MNTENPNGQKQSDSYQDDVFINTSEQQGKLFHFMGNTSFANQPKNQQVAIEAVPQQEMQCQEYNENMQVPALQDPYLSPVSPNVMSQQGSWNMTSAGVMSAYPTYQAEPSPMILPPDVTPQQGLYNNTPQTMSVSQNIVQPAMSNSNVLQQGEQKQTYCHTYCPVVMEDFNAC